MTRLANIKNVLNHTLICSAQLLDLCFATLCSFLCFKMGSVPEACNWFSKLPMIICPLKKYFFSRDNQDSALWCVIKNESDVKFFLLYLLFFVECIHFSKLYSFSHCLLVISLRLFEKYLTNTYLVLFFYNFSIFSPFLNHLSMTMAAAKLPPKANKWYLYSILYTVLLIVESHYMRLSDQ